MQTQWIVWCDGVVYGVGSTAQDALDCAREFAPDWDGRYTFTTDNHETSGVVYLARATEQLCDAVRRGDVGVAFRSVDGVQDVVR